MVKTIGARVLLAFSLAATILVGQVPVLGHPAVASAAAAPKYYQLDISVWPEYDEPRNLVIYNGSLADNNPLPQPITLEAPAGARINMTCEVSADGQHK